MRFGRAGAIRDPYLHKDPRSTSDRTIHFPVSRATRFSPSEGKIRSITDISVIVIHREEDGRTREGETERRAQRTNRYRAIDESDAFSYARCDRNGIVVFIVLYSANRLLYTRIEFSMELRRQIQETILKEPSGVFMSPFNPAIALPDREQRIEARASS